MVPVLDRLEVEVIRWISLQLVKREAEGRIQRSQTALYGTSLKDEPKYEASGSAKWEPTADG
jgi:hypothetical protein